MSKISRSFKVDLFCDAVEPISRRDVLFTIVCLGLASHFGHDE